MATNRNVPNRTVFRTIRNSISRSGIGFNVQNGTDCLSRPRLFSSRGGLREEVLLKCLPYRLPIRDLGSSSSQRYGALNSQLGLGSRVQRASASTAAAVIQQPDSCPAQDTPSSEPRETSARVVPAKSASNNAMDNFSPLVDSSPPAGTPPSKAKRTQKTELAPPYLSPDQEPPPSVLHGRFLNDVDYGANGVEATLTSRHHYLYNHILMSRKTHSRSVALEVLGTIVDMYVSTGLRADWKLAMDVYISSCQHFPSAYLRPIRNSTIHSMLQQSPPRLEAVSLLFAKLPSDRGQSDQYVRQYLSDFCKKHKDHTVQFAEARKVLHGARLCRKPLNTRVLMPLVMQAIEARQPERAHDLIRRLGDEFDLPTNFAVLNELVKGYAREENWSALGDLYADLHSKGFSRSKPLQYAALARTHWRLFASNQSPERAYDLLTNLISDYGLVPTEGLSVAVIKSFVLVKRFDLVAKWTTERLARFPSALSPARSPGCAYEICDAWVQSEASPADVLATCSALAQGAIRDPFSYEFRHQTNGYMIKLVSTLSANLAAHNKRLSVGKRGCFETTTLTVVLRHAFSLMQTMRGMSLDTRQALMLSVFSDQLMKANHVHHLLNHFERYIQLRGPIQSKQKSQFRAIAVEPMRNEPADFDSTDTTILDLTGTELVEAVMKDAYVQTRKGSLFIVRRVINVIKHLRQQSRPYDVCVLVSELWKSGFVKEPEHVSIVIKAWVEAAKEMHSSESLRDAIWAALDSGPSYRLTRTFLLLVHMSVHEVRRDAGEYKMRRLSPIDQEELDYLISRLYRRIWQTGGSQGIADIADPRIKTWLEKEHAESVVPVLRKEYSSGWKKAGPPV